MIIRKRYHDAVNKLGKMTNAIAASIDIIEYAQERGLPPDLPQILAILKIGDAASKETLEELRVIKDIHYKLCDPDTDLDHLTEKRPE